MVADEGSGSEASRPSESSLRDVEGWLFDLDGVLTDTARVHVAAWKAVFDEVLERLASDSGTPFVPFDPVGDYERYVDGKPRYDGVRDFLGSRGLVLPEGERTDPPDRLTVSGVGNRKNELVLEKLAHGDVEVFGSSVTLVESLRAAGRRTAVVSASENCIAVLESVGIVDLFDAIVDGVVARERHLRGKPAPDTFLFASAQLGTPPARSAVVEDAPAGVAAGRDGGFGTVIGVARRASPDELTRAGADIVVSDLGELPRPSSDT